MGKNKKFVTYKYSIFLSLYNVKGELLNRTIAVSIYKTKFVSFAESLGNSQKDKQFWKCLDGGDSASAKWFLFRLAVRTDRIRQPELNKRKGIQH